MRDLSRPRLEPSCVGAQPQQVVALREAGGPSEGTDRPLRRAQGYRVATDPTTGKLQRQLARAAAQGSRDLRAMSRAPRGILRVRFPDDGCPTRTRFRRSPGVSTSVRGCDGRVPPAAGIAGGRPDRPRSSPGNRRRPLPAVHRHARCGSGLGNCGGHYPGGGWNARADSRNARGDSTTGTRHYLRGHRPSPPSGAVSIFISAYCCSPLPRLRRHPLYLQQLMGNRTAP